MFVITQETYLFAPVAAPEYSMLTVSPGLTDRAAVSVQVQFGNKMSSAIVNFIAPVGGKAADRFMSAPPVLPSAAVDLKICVLGYAGITSR